MKSSSGSTSKEDASGGQPGKPPHWRRRDPAATAVYVVHPTQFRTIVQQLTGPASPPPVSTTGHAHHQGARPGPAAGGGTNAAAQQQAQHQQHAGGRESSSGRTLGQMYQECMAWAKADDN